MLKQISLFITKEQNDRLVKAAAKVGCSKSNIIRGAIWKEVQRIEKGTLN